VSEGIQEKGVAETELLPLTADEEDCVDFRLVELGSVAPELKERVYQALRTQVHIKGDFLHASLDNVHHGVRNTEQQVSFSHVRLDPSANIRCKFLF